LVAFVFATTHDALDVEALLGDLGIEVVPIPVPPAMGAGCGVALRLALADEARASEYVARAGIAVAARTEVQDV
jgi:hypothetical protein